MDERNQEGASRYCFCMHACGLQQLGAVWGGALSSSYLFGCTHDVTHAAPVVFWTLLQFQDVNENARICTQARALTGTMHPGSNCGAPQAVHHPSSRHAENTCSRPDANDQVRPKLAACRIVVLASTQTLKSGHSSVSSRASSELITEPAQHMQSDPSSRSSNEQRHIVPAGADCRACSPPPTSVPGSSVFMRTRPTSHLASLHPQFVQCRCSNWACSPPSQVP